MFTVLSVNLSLGQQRVMMEANYSINVPSGNFKNYIEKASFRGWNATIAYRVSEKLSIGGTVGFQDFYQKNERALYKNSDGADISAVVTNSIQTIPVLASIQYALMSEGLIQPYIGLGIGANMIMHTEYYGQFGSDQNKLGFAARPQAGVFIPFHTERQLGANLAVVYNLMPYKSNGVENLNNWGVNLGVKFPLR